MRCSLYRIIRYTSYQKFHETLLVLIFNFRVGRDRQIECRTVDFGKTDLASSEIWFLHLISNPFDSVDAFHQSYRLANHSIHGEGDV